MNTPVKGNAGIASAVAGQAAGTGASAVAAGNANASAAGAANPANTQQQQHLKSKDALVIGRILKDMGVEEYEPAVVYQLLEFTYRYVSTVLDDAQIFSNYAKKKNIDSEDVRLAIQLQVEKMFTSPPPRDLLLEIARSKNNQTLPPIRSHAGLRLPPDRYSLTVCNYGLKTAAKIKTQQQQQQAHIQLPFRTNAASTLLSNGARSSLISLQARPTSNLTQLSSTSVTTTNLPSSSSSGTGTAATLPSTQISLDANSSVSKDNTSVKRKLDDSTD